ncbi:MAG: hypothetical protein RIR70_620 [Pseudomonadota bacterium]
MHTSCSPVHSTFLVSVRRIATLLRVLLLAALALGASLGLVLPAQADVAECERAYQLGRKDEAIKLCRRAAWQENDFFAQVKLGDIYSAKREDDKGYYDPVEAYVWYFIAAHNSAIFDHFHLDAAADFVVSKLASAENEAEGIYRNLLQDERIDALVLQQVAIDAFGFVFRTCKLADHEVRSRIEMEVIENGRVMSRDEVPDIGFNRIVVAFVILPLGGIDVTQLHLRKEIVLLPGRASTQLDRFILAPELVGTLTLRHIRLRGKYKPQRGAESQGCKQQHPQQRCDTPHRNQESAVHGATRSVHGSSHAMAAVQLRSGLLPGWGSKTSSGLRICIHTVPDSKHESSAREAKSEIKSRLYACLRTRHMRQTNFNARTQN